MSLKSRLERLRQKSAEKELDALLVSQAENRCYLSGLDGWDGLLLITPQAEIIATDFRFIEQAKRQAPDYEIFPIGGSLVDWFPRLVTGHKIKRLGLESGDITLAFNHQLTTALSQTEAPPKLVATEGIVESLRVVKEPEEIELIAQAAAISDRAVEHITEIILAGMSEIEAAWAIEKFMREQGSQSLPFTVIVAAGSNSALPHAQPSARPIAAGEPVVIDIGARIGGYGSDLTRTICLGCGDDTYNLIYDTVLSAQLAAIDGIREGMTGHQADSIARQVIKQAGYGEAFGHSLGHGVGLAPHELPRLGPNSAERLTEGMVFTIEPGIYLSGWGGVRIEDTVVMENGKIRVISKARKD